MICQNFPPFEDFELLMALDGQADPEVAMHMSQCPYCQERVAQLAQIQHAATTRLFRAACPSALELGEYRLGILPAATSAHLQQHLASCHYCAQELLQLASFMDGPDPYLRPDSLAAIKQSIHVLVARLASRPQFSGLTGQPAFYPSLAGLRGEAAGPLTYEAGDAQIILDIQNDQQHTDRKSIVGLLIGGDDQNVQVHLWHDEQRIVSTAVDTFGNFSIDGLAPGAYELFLTGEHSEIHIQDLHV
jgi:anti-sigma factor RsiW